MFILNVILQKVGIEINLIFLYICVSNIAGIHSSDTGISTQADEEEGEGEADEDTAIAEPFKNLINEQEEKKELEKKVPKKKKKKKK